MPIENYINFAFSCYNGLIRPIFSKGGIIGFHDIKVYDSQMGCEVKKFWNEIKKQYTFKEIIDEVNTCAELE